MGEQTKNDFQETQEKLGWVLNGLKKDGVWYAEMLAEDVHMVFYTLESKKDEVERLRKKLAAVSCLGCGFALEGGGLCEDCQLEEEQWAMDEGLIE